MKLLTGLLKTNVTADLFQPDDVNADDAILTFVKNTSLQIDTYYGSSLMAITNEVIPVRWVVQNLTDNFGKRIFGDISISGSDALRITTVVPIVNNLTGIELYRYTLARV